VAPDGGPRDVKVPRILNCDPPNFSLNFSSNKIKIDFDEFVSLKNAATEISVSPPLKHPIEAKVRSKSIIINIEDTLQPNTTYSIYFGNAINDITENNVLTDFYFVFSTGPYLDSLSFQGKVISAFDLSPQKEITAMLYIDNIDTIPFDSLPFKVKPYYVSKTGAEGNFSFRNLKNSPMRIIALSDLNGNLMVDRFSEKIAFCDSLIQPYYIPPPAKDSTTSLRDSINQDLSRTPDRKPVPKDSIKQDSLKATKPAKLLTMALFTETDSTQKIKKSMFLRRDLALIVFALPLKKPVIRALDRDTATAWALTELLPNRDSVYLWLFDSQKDTLLLEVKTSEQKTDTVRLEYFAKDNKNSKKNDPDKSALGSSNNIYSGTLNQFDDQLKLLFSSPLKSARFDRIKLISNKDTLPAAVAFPDSIHRTVSVKTDWKEDRNYSVYIPDSVFNGINGKANDTIRFSFKTMQERDFGNIMLKTDLGKLPGNYIIQLLNESNAIISSRATSASGTISFLHIKPGKYKFKFIHDRNKNGRWDTGDFRYKIQPEKVSFLGKTIEIRANWDVEESWTPEP
jgi:hypothetical protein